MNHDSYPDSTIRGILNTVKTIAVVGASQKENRPSYFAFKYLLERGYRMIPVNPGHDGQTLLGQKIYAALPTSPSRWIWSIFSAARNMRWGSCKKRSRSPRGRK
jgi:predicted CoA-binding protein